MREYSTDRAAGALTVSVDELRVWWNAVRQGEHLIALPDWQLSCAPDRFTSKANATSARCGARSITPLLIIAHPTREAFEKTLVRDRFPLPARGTDKF